MSIAIADINRDGHFDMYVSGYIRLDLVEGQNIFNKEGYGGTSAMLLNNGDNSFSDITESSGLYYKHNTFLGVFVDFDGDGLEDLVVAHDTGQVRTWKNMGDNRFKNMPNPNSGQNSYPMGIAVSDYNNDGRVDLFFSNVGSTAPDMLVKGDLRDDQILNKKWIMFENKGDFNFADVGQQRKVADYEFSWGADPLRMRTCASYGHSRVPPGGGEHLKLRRRSPPPASTPSFTAQHALRPRAAATRTARTARGTPLPHSALRFAQPVA